jgi:hypothetical protein
VEDHKEIDMKNNLFSRALSFSKGRAAIRLGVPMALLLCSATCTPAEDGNGHNSIVGTWITSATLSIIPPGFPADGKFQAVETFNSDGTMLVVSQIPGVTIGAGVWKATGPLRFTFTFTFYRPDPGSPQKMLAVVVNENVRMTSENTYVTTDVIEPLDANGVPLFQFPGTVSATRYPFANFNTTLP